MTSNGLSVAIAMARSVKEGFVRHPLRDNRPYPTMIVTRAGDPIAMCDLEKGWTDPSAAVRETIAVLAPDEAVLILEAGPEPAQSLDVFWATSAGDSERTSLPYRCVGETVEWDAPTTSGEPTNELADALRAGFAAAGNLIDNELARTALKSAGVRVRFVADPNPFIDLEADDPCPCESGRRYGDCHGH